MTDLDLWELRALPDGLALEVRGGAAPALVLTQGENRVRVELAHVNALVAALTDAAADLAELLAGSGELRWLPISSTGVSCAEIAEIRYHAVQSTIHLESITA